MPWAKQTITINGESVEATAKIYTEQCSGEAEIPFSKDNQYNIGDSVSIGNYDFTISTIKHRHEEITVLGLKMSELKPKPKKTKKKEKITYDDRTEN